MTRLNRRQLLVRGGVAVGAGAAAAVGAGVAARELTAESQPDVSSWDGVRARFDLDHDVVQMTAFLLAPHPQPVREAIERHRSGLDRDPKTYLFEHERALEEAVASAAAEYLGTGSDEIAFTDSTTMGLGLVYSTIRLREGDEIVTTQHDHYATHESLRLRVARTPGVAMRKVSLYDDGAPLSEDQIVARLRAAIGPRTRLVALTWVHSSTGVKLPIRAIADMLAEADAARPILLAVDGVHALGVESARLSQLGCDYFFAGCHKWLFGPRGTGLVWARPDAWREVTPVIPTFDGRSYFAWIQGRDPEDLPPGPAMTAGGFHSFEHRWALAEAFGFHGEIGPDRITERTHELAAQLKDGLADIRRVRLITPRASELSAGIVCFEVDGVPAPDVVDRLEERGVVASVTPYATEYVRMGPSIANSPADVDSALRTLRSFL